MTFLIIAAVAFGLLLLARMRVGVALEYIAQRLVVKLRVGVFSFPVYPSQKKSTPQSKSKTPAPNTPKKPLSRYLPFVPCVLRAVMRVLRQLRVDRLDLDVRVGGKDPAETAVRYGRLNAAVGSVWGPFNSLLTVKRADVHLDVDFDAEGSRAQGMLSISWRISQLLTTLLIFAHDALLVAYQNRTTNKQEGSVT